MNYQHTPCIIKLTDNIVVDTGTVHRVVISWFSAELRTNGLFKELHVMSLNAVLESVVIHNSCISDESISFVYVSSWSSVATIDHTNNTQVEDLSY